MSMFGALVPQNQNPDFGTESYEEVVDNFCAALEDVESELSAFEMLGDSIDNAEAFAAAIESCGATPALMQFGYSCDDSFEQLIGRAAPSDFATEDMAEFGSFALESIKSKLKLAWEAVKDFIIRLWEKLKEFGRWILSLFDRKEAKLRAIIKAATDKKVKNKDFAHGKSSTRHLRCFTASKIHDMLAGADMLKAGKAVVERIANGIKAKQGNFDKADFAVIGDAIASVGKKFFQANTKTGDVLLATELKNEFKERTLDAAGFKSFDDIIKAAEACIATLQSKRVLEAMVQDFGKLVSTVDSYARDVKSVQEDIDGKDKDKKDREEVIVADTQKRYAIMLCRKGSIACSKVNILCGKIINNCCASVIAVAKEAGL